MPSRDTIPWNRVQRAALMTGIACTVLCGVGALASPILFLRGYLAAYNYWLGIALGSLAIVMVYHLTGGRWGLVIGRLAEAASRTLPLLVVLFVPLLLGIGALYPWASAEVVAQDPVLQHKSIYLNAHAMVARAAVYFTIWLVLAHFLSRWSRRRDETDGRLRTLSGPGLVLYGLTITFAAVDWVMSLEPHWFSTIFAVVFGINQVLSALSFAIAALALVATRSGAMGSLISTQVCRDLGNLLLTVVMFWAYTAFAQFLLIWAGNMPEEIAWYLPRFAGAWLWVAVFLILCQFAMPFVFLLFRRTKNELRLLSRIAVFLLATCFVNLLWQIVPAPLPEAFGEGNEVGWSVGFALLAMGGVGGLWLAMFLWELKKMPLVPLHAAGLADTTEPGRPGPESGLEEASGHG